MAIPISWFKISGLRSFNESQEILFATPVAGKPGSGLNIVVGPNSSGKSTLLEAIDLAARAKNYTLPKQFRNNRTEYRTELEIGWKDTARCKLASNHQNPQQLLATSGVDQNRAVTYLTNRRDITSPVQYEGFDKARMLRDHPHAIQRAGIWGEWLPKRIPQWKAPGSRFEELLEKVLGHRLRMFTDGQILNFAVAGHEHEAPGLGAGIISAISIVDRIHDADEGSTLIIDEPEIALHPMLQKRLMRVIVDESQRLQIILATHSPYMVSWDAIFNGARISRVFRDIEPNPYSRIGMLSSSTIERLTPLVTNLNNPHILGTNANEVFFLPDGVILVEGQEDVQVMKLIAPVVGAEDLADRVYGWGAGGSENIQTIAAMVSELGFRRVVLLYDGNKKEEAQKAREAYAHFRVFILPTDDIRDKIEPAKPARNVCGLTTTKGTLHPNRIADATQILRDIAEALKS